MFNLNNNKMKIKNKLTGNSFNLSSKEAADFFYAKNARKEYINTLEDYEIEDKSEEISDGKFYFLCVCLSFIMFSSFLLYLNLNY